MELKTTINIEITSKDSLPVFPKEGETEKDYKGKEKELATMRKTFAKEFHKEAIKFIKYYFKENFEEEFLDSLEEHYIEGWEDLKAYGTKIKIKTE